MIVQVWEVKRVACYARAETFTEAVTSLASMVATPLEAYGLCGGMSKLPTQTINFHPSLSNGSDICIIWANQVV